ncbi:hypothetical protein INR49_000508, partial [Caranx melampygus]
MKEMHISLEEEPVSESAHYIKLHVPEQLFVRPAVSLDICGSGSHLIKPGTAESDSECEEEEKSSNVAVIVGCSVIVLLLLFLVGVFRKKKKQAQETVEIHQKSWNGAETDSVAAGDDLHISVTWCLQSKKTTKLIFKMTSCRNPLTAATLLILMMRDFRGNTLPCHPAEYLIGNECCLMCPAGSRVETDCTEFRSTSCLPCIDGTFMNQPTGLKQCFPSTQCYAGPGVRIKSSCTTTSDAVCEPLEGYYCIDPEGSSCLAAKKHTPCRSGQYISEKGTALTDTVCSDCSEGTFSDGTFTSCRPHTQCGSGSQLIKPGTNESDAECEEEKKSSNVTVIVGCIVTALLFLVSVIVIAVCCKKKNMCQQDGVKGLPAGQRASAGDVLHPTAIRDQTLLGHHVIEVAGIELSEA